ncbi:MAG: Stk1 family PASTA domain-containing Ser/Thr kinase [Acidimicrobiales bacterium]
MPDDPNATGHRYGGGPPPGRDAGQQPDAAGGGQQGEALPRTYKDRYQIVRRIARGGMAEVFLARDLLLDRPVALKILFPELSTDRAFVERFRREAQAAANLAHANIVSVYDWGEEEGGTYFIVMEYVDGRPLSALIRSEGPLLADRAAQIGAEVAKALTFAHRHGVIHRDVKPGNVLITKDGSVKVTDFGIARAKGADDQLTQTGAVMGTATYFSPEQAQGERVDARSDVYSLGVVLYEMAAGRPPFTGDNPLSIAYKHVREAPPPLGSLNSAVPLDFEAVVSKAMAKRADQRYQSAEELRADLLRFSQGRTVAARALGGAATATTRAVSSNTEAMRGTRALLGTRTLSTTDTQSIPATVVDEEDIVGETGPRTWPWVAILVVMVLVLGILLYLLGRALGFIPAFKGDVTVPHVIGKPYATAAPIVVKAGLHVTKATEASSKPASTVLKESPAPGITVPNGTLVTLYVSTGHPDKAIPKVIGDSLSRAESLLGHQGFHWHVKVSSSVPATATQKVLRTSPRPGTMAQTGSYVTLTVTKALATVAVPSVSGDGRTTAGNVLGRAGLVVGPVTYSSSNSIPSGKAIGTQPPAGAPVQVGSTVTLVLSSGPATSPVPDVQGQTQAQAQSTLTGNGFTVKVAYAPITSASQVAGTVISQNPVPGTHEPAGYQVVITIGQPSTTTTTTSPTSTTSTTSTTSPTTTTTTLPG